jgi:hypothetical protein
MAIGTNDLIRCACVWQVAAEEQVNVHYLTVTGIAAQTQEQIRQDIAEWFTDGYTTVVGLMWGSINHLRIELFNVTDGNPEPTISAQALLDGSNAGELLPAQVAAEVYFRTGVSRRIGRTFLPTFTEATISDAAWVAGTLTGLQTFGNYCRDIHVLTNGVNLEKKIYDRAGAVARDIIEAVVPFDSRTQRRRRVGVGS